MRYPSDQRSTKGECLAIRGHLLFAELLIQPAIEDIGNLLAVPCLAVLVSVAHFFCSGLVEEEGDKVWYDW